ncbi:MAG: hypothetical protein R6X25_07900 [Candidatus Krumholzibacteriia bacterium]
MTTGTTPPAGGPGSVEEFANQAGEELGIGRDDALRAVGALLKYARQRAGADADVLIGRLPGADRALAAAEQEPAGGGLMGGFLGKARRVLGNAGSTMEAVSLLRRSGLGGEKASHFVARFVAFARSTAGDEPVARVLNQMPELQQARTAHEE